MSTRMDEALEKAQTFEEKLSVHQRHWQWVAAKKLEQVQMLQHMIDTPFDCCRKLWPRGGMCPACHRARIF